MTVMLQLVVLGSITGVVAIILGGVLGFKVLPDVIEEKLQDNVRLELSETFRNWENPPFDVTTKIHFFHVRNYGAIETGGNPIVEEMEPIIYKTTRKKDKTVYDPITDTFSYEEWVTHEYDESSPVKETDTVITLNVLKWMSLLIAEDQSIMNAVKEGFADVFPDTENNNLFHTIKIKDFLIDGYKMSTTGNTAANILSRSIISVLKDNPRFIQHPEDNSYHFFAFRTSQKYKENNYAMYGGVKDITKQGQIKSVNGLSALEIWDKTENNYCNAIRGTDSFTFNPDFDVDQEMAIFNNDMCRSLDYAFTEEVEVKEFTGHRLILKSENFQYPDVDNVNKCFCIESDNKCIEDGFLNLYKCFPGIPLIASQPHFLYTDPKHAEKLNFKPTVQKDVSYIDIETESGVVLSVSRKTQYNIYIRKIPGFNEKIVPFMLPLFWVEETMKIPDHSADILNDVYFDDLVMIEWIKWGLLVIGVVLLLISVGTFVLSKLNLNNKS